MRFKIDIVESVVIVICLIFIIAMSFYHISFNGYLGIGEKTWDVIWAFSENGLLLFMSYLISMLTAGVLRMFFQWIFIPYFSLKLIYHLSCYSGIYLFSPQVWGNIWSVVLVFIFLIFLILILIKKRHV